MTVTSLPQSTNGTTPTHGARAGKVVLSSVPALTPFSVGSTPSPSWTMVLHSSARRAGSSRGSAGKTSDGDR
jgi:hypothetical protein